MDEDKLLAEIRRAAFELRHEDAQEAVRVLRRCAGAGGGAEVLARGALGEIYLEEFGDLDGAEHEFRRVLELSPGLFAAELGLSRTLREAGDEAQAALYLERALGGMARDLEGFRSGKGELPEGLEELVLTALDTAVELNGTQLKLTAGGDLPQISAIRTPPGPVTLAPASITFLAMPAPQAVTRG